MHISVHSSTSQQGDKDTNLAPTLTPPERSFLQSIITHLPSICALTLPTSASYGRMLDGIWAGGTYACWGTDNREAPLRLCGAPGGHHFELKTSDATANPYLALAGVLGAGLLGVEKQVKLIVGDCAKPAFSMTEDERKAVGLENPGRLPGTIRDARALLVANKELSQVLGENFVEKYIAMNEVRRSMFECERGKLLKIFGCQDLENFLNAGTEEDKIDRLIAYF